MSIRMLRATVVGILAAGLVACSGLPTGGPVNPGLPLGTAQTSPDFTFLPDGPARGATPEQILTGFIDAATSPADNWAIAQQFLMPALIESWEPEAAVTIDRSWTQRAILIEAETDDHAELDLVLTPIAGVDEGGTYTESTGLETQLRYELARNDAGEWRIAAAPDGIVLDADSFAQVFRRYSLQYFDPTWTHLVPDVRWFPRRPNLATTITQALISGPPADWLAPVVRSAFPGDVGLAIPGVPVDDEQVAQVQLTSGALGLDAITLARMRTQLERSLVGAGIQAVQFSVEGRALEADSVNPVPNRIEQNMIVLTEAEFGFQVGDEVEPIPGITDAILGSPRPVTAVELSGDHTRAAVQLDDASVWRLAGGRIDELDSRPGLIPPAMDPQLFTWTVPATAPQQVIAWSRDGVEHAVAEAWPDASSVSQLRIAPDGTRIAAVVTVGGQIWATVAGIVRDADGVPTGLGPVERLTRLSGAAQGLVWLGDETVGILVSAGGDVTLLEQPIGGPAVLTDAPEGTVGIAGANTTSGVRLLTDTGAVWIKRGTTWQTARTEVLLLGTQAGRF